MKTQFLLFTIALGATFFPLAPANATDKTFTVGSDWAVGTWSPAGVPTASDNAFINSTVNAAINTGTAAVSQNTTVGNARTLSLAGTGTLNTGVLTIGDASDGTFALTGAGTLTASGITMSPGAGKSTLTLGGAGTLNIGGGTGSITKGAGAGASTIQVNANVGALGLSSVSVSSLYIGINAVTGTLTINSGQTYTLSTDVQVGRATTGTAGTGTLNLNGGTLTTPTFSVNQLQAGTLNNSVVNLNSGGTLNAATIQRVYNGASQAFNWNDGTIANITTGNLSLTKLTDTANLVISLAGTGTHTFNASSTRAITVQTSAVLQDKSGESGTLAKTGAGTLILNGANTYSGGTTVSAGVLCINHATAIGSGALTLSSCTLSNGSGSAITLANNNAQNWNGNFVFAGTSDLNLGTGAVTLGATPTMTITGNLSVGGVIGGAYGLYKAGVGVLTLSGANTYSGETTNNTGTLRLGAANVIPNGSGKGSVTMGANGILDLNGFSETINGLNGSGVISNGVAGTQTLTVGDNDQDGNYSGIITTGTGDLALTKMGAGTVQLQGANTFTGGVTINAGVIASANGGLSSGTMTLNGGALASVNNNSRTWTNAITVGGDFTLGQATTFTGALILSGNMNLNGATRTITVANTAVSGDTLSGVISNGGVTKAGAGTLVMNGVNTYTGNTTNSAGMLLLNNTNYSAVVEVLSGATLGGTGVLRTVTLDAGGLLAPGNAGIGKLTVTNLTLAATATNLFEFDAGLGTNDTVDVGGALTPGGSVMQVSVTNGTLAAGSYRLVNYLGPKTGTFNANVVLASGSAAGGLRLKESVANQINLLVNHAPVANGDSLSWGRGTSNKNLSITNLLANDTDADGDPIALLGVDAASANGVSLTTNATSIQYNGALTNNDSFNYTISDGFGGTASALVVITATNNVGQISGSITVSGGQATTIFFGISGDPYVVQRSTNLTDWVSISTNTAPASGLITNTDTFSDLVPPPPPYPSAAYYRIQTH